MDNLVVAMREIFNALAPPPSGINPEPYILSSLGPPELLIFSLAQAPVTPLPPAPTIVPPAPPPEQPVPPPETNVPPPQNSPNTSLSPGAIAGIVCGVLVSLGLLGGLGAMSAKKWRERNQPPPPHRRERSVSEDVSPTQHIVPSATDHSSAPVFKKVSFTPRKAYTASTTSTGESIKEEGGSTPVEEGGSTPLEEGGSTPVEEVELTPVEGHTRT